MVLGFTAANTVQNYGNGLAGFVAAAILALEFLVSRRDFPEMDRTLATAAAAFIFAAALPMVYYSQLTLVVVSTNQEDMLAPFAEPSGLSSIRVKGEDEEGAFGVTRFHYAEPRVIGNNSIDSCDLVEDQVVYFQSLSEATDALRKIGLREEDRVVTFGSFIDPFWFTTNTDPIPGGHLWYMGTASLPERDLLKKTRFFAIKKCEHESSYDQTWKEAREASGMDFSKMNLRAETQHWLIYENPDASSP